MPQSAIKRRDKIWAAASPVPPSLVQQPVSGRVLFTFEECLGSIKLKISDDYAQLLLKKQKAASAYSY